MNKITYVFCFTFFTIVLLVFSYFTIKSLIIEDNGKSYLDYAEVDFNFYLEKLKLETGNSILKCNNYENKTIIYHHRSKFEIYAYLENKEIVLCHSFE